MPISHRNPVRGKHCARIVIAAAAAAIGGAQRAGAAQVAYRSLVTAKNPLTYLMLDEPAGSASAADSGTNGTPTPGTFGSGVTLGQTSAGAILNTALTTNGTATPITIAASDAKFDNIGTGDFTVEMWFNTSNITTREDLFNFKGTATNTSDLGIQLSSETADHLSIFHTTGFKISSTAAVTANQWHHLALTRVGLTGAETLYLDGAVVGSATDTQTLSTLNTGTLAVGSKSFGPTFRVFTGSIDEYALYNTALTPAEVQAHIAAVPEPAAIGLLLAPALGLLARRRRRA
ncbi:MAG: domain containing protein [Phycisphaerales bacterium]|nr:domain containing protein [Phycisphaerales bacterium]